MIIHPNTAIYDSRSAAEYLGVKTDTVRKYVERGLLRPWDGWGGQAHLFLETELKRFQIERRGRGRPPAA